MKFPFKAILIGLLVGATIFFVPFRFPFFFLFIFIFLFSRFFFWRRGQRGFYSRHRGYDFHNEIIPIDGYGRNRNFSNQEKERNINIQ